MSNPDSWYDPPDDDDPRCECGHGFDDHNDPDDVKDDPGALVDALYEIEEICNGEGLGKCEYNVIGNIISRTLASCQAQGCTCRKYYASVTDDGGDYAYDTMIDKRGER